MSEVSAAARGAFAGRTFVARAATLHHAAVWSLRTLLAVVIFSWFSAAPPRASHLALTLELGRRAVLEHYFEFGWLGAACAYLADAAAGFGGMAALGGILVVAALALVEFRARPRTGDVLSLAAMIFAAFCFLDVLRVGGGAAHWVCAAAFVLAVERARGWGLCVAVAIAIVWANVSADAVLAPFLAALVTIGRVIDGRLSRAASVQMAFVVVGCAAALLLTPEGFAYVARAPLAAHLDRDLAGLIPFSPSAIAPRAYLVLFGMLAAGAALGLQRCRWEDRLLFAAVLMLGFWNGEYLPLAGIVGAPVLVGTVVRVAPQFFAQPSSRGRLANGLIAAIAIVLALGFAGSTPARVARAAAVQDPAESVINRAAGDGRAHHMLCSVVEWCNYAIAFRNVDVMMDARVERAGLPVREDQFTITRAKPGWRHELAARGIDTIVVRRTDALGQLLAFVPRWEAIDLENGIVLYEKSAAR
jgi:hypothetical protein